jgi:hypothetical protein
MEVTPRRLEELSDAKCTYASGTLPRTGYKVLIVTISGVAANQQPHAGTYQHISAAIMAGTEAWEPDALVLDFRNLEYSWGDGMQETLRAGERWHQTRLAAVQLSNLLGTPRPVHFCTAIIASARCRDGLTSLLRDEMREDPERWLFDSLDACVEPLDHRLASAALDQPFKFRDVYHVMDLIRARPGMYGIPEKSFKLLQVFIAGLACGEIDAGEPTFWDFPLWTTVGAGVTGTSKPLHWLESSQSDEEAYQTYFRLLDEYRRCRSVELARLPGSMVRHRPSFQIVNGKTVPYTPPTPDAVTLGRYEPSEVYFVAQVFGERTETFYDSVQPSAEAAMAVAEKWWSIDPAAWNYRRA